MDYYPEQNEEYNQTLRWGDPGIAVMQRLPGDANDLQSLVQAAMAFIEHTQSTPITTPATHRSSEYWMYAEGQWLAHMISRFLGCSHVGIALFKPKTGMLKPIAETGLILDERWQWWSQVQQAPIGTSLRKSDIARLRADEVVVREPEQIQQQLSSTRGAILLAPVRIDQELAGVIAVELVTEQSSLAATTVLTRAFAKLVAQAFHGETLRQSLPKLEHKVQSQADDSTQIGAFLSQTCHELRTPLTTIKASVQLAERQLQRLDLAAARNETVADSLENVHHLLNLTNRHINLEDNLINDLLEMARIQAGKLEMHPIQYDLASIVREAVEGQQLIWPEREIRLDLPDVSIPVETDPNRLMQVIGNYLSNAFKYSPADKPIDVKLCVKNQRARVAVSDAGVGMPKHELKHIWERFYRVSGVKVHGGTSGSLGLGLYICRAIIQRQKGKVGVRSTPGQGSTFWFTLPLIATPSAEPMQL